MSAPPLAPTSPAQRPRVGILVTGYGVWNSPSLVSAAQVLAEHGYQVDIFTDTREKPEYVNADALSIEVHSIGITLPPAPNKNDARHGAVPRRRNWRTVLRTTLPVPLDKALLALWITGPHLFAFILRAGRIIGDRHYLCFIGAETTGLAAASVLGALRRVPVVYWSLELWLWSESRSLYYRILKLLETLFHPSAAFTIIPSEEWVPLLAAENGVPVASFVVVPATVRGPARVRQSDYLRSRLEIPDKQRLIVYAGTLTSWALTKEIAAVAHRWPSDWTLVVHGWGDAKYIEEVKRAAPQDGRVRLSLNVVPPAELDDLIASADVGIALYRNDVMARRLVTSASGKISQYLKCGVPLITNDSPGFRKLFAQYPCGVGVASPDDIALGVQTILARHSDFRRTAVRCFEEKYDFDVHFAAVLERLGRLE